VGLAFRLVIGLASGELLHLLIGPSFWLHALGMIPSTATWLLCRGKPLPINKAIAAETAGLLGTSVAFIGMGMTIAPEVSADVITAFTLSFAFFSRAVFVPREARHTALLGVAIGVPLVGMMAVHYLDVDPQMWREVGYDTRGFERRRIVISSALMTTMWWTLTVAWRPSPPGSSIGFEARFRAFEASVNTSSSESSVRARWASSIKPPTAGLTHSHTVTIYEYGRTPEGLFHYAMELLDGSNLQQIVEATGPQPVRRAVRILRDVALALDEAHSVGLIHRDVKPTNMMLAKQGGVHP
jgi:serine/threonine-protein kinase